VVTFEAIREARRRIAPHVHRTPVMTSATLDAELGARVFFKCENLQKVGAFKARGAVNAVLLLRDDEAKRGVVSHSSGNHAAALAYAARIRQIPCTVVMPRSASPIKVEAVRSYGARIVFCAEGQRESACEAVIGETGACFVPPFDDPAVIAGQGTAALELLEDRPGLDVVVAPVGGGGLLAGTAVAAAGTGAEVRVHGAEPEAVDDAYRSLVSGVRQPAVRSPRTVADGLLTGLGELNFSILRRHGVLVVTVSEHAILRAARDLVERMKLVVEPSAATVLAAIRKQQAAWEGLSIGAILSGGNTDLRWLTE
jgi:threonine dehydratase